MAQRDEVCYGQRAFPVPSADGVPFEVIVGGQKESRALTNAKAKTREFATYNLLSLEADNILYHPGEKTLEATRDVLIEDESGEHKAHSTTLHIQDGRAIPIRRDR
jgi:hypothetical protein